MINDFRITGEIKAIGNDRTICLLHVRAIMSITCDSKLKIEKYHVGEKVEVSGRISTYGPLHAVKLIATKIEALKEEEVK